MTADAATTPGTLVGLLNDERACCARLLSLLEAERAAAASYDHAALLACLREREILQAEWQRTAAARRRAHATASGGSLVRLAADDPELAAVLRDTAREAAAVRRAQRVNEGIVRAALAHVTDLLAVIRREHTDNRYDGRAALTSAALSSAGGRWSA